MRLSIMAGAIEWVLALQQGAASRETSEEGKKRGHRRYRDAVGQTHPAQLRLSARSSERGKVTEQELATLHGIITELAHGRRAHGRIEAPHAAAPGRG
ncbi:MAG: hypothetical protein ACREFJ_02570 [Acetobacteraceae bacterium]